MGLQDFTTYTEVDSPDGVIAVTDANTLTMTDMPRDDSHYAYDDKGAAHFSGDFEHLVKTSWNSATNDGAIAGVWALSNTIGPFNLWFNSAPGLAVHWYPTGGGWLRIYSTNPAVSATVKNLFADTDYYLKIKRVDLRTTLYIYDDEARTSLVGSVFVDETDAADSFRYIYGVAGYDTSRPDLTISYLVEDLDLQEGTAYYKTVTESLGISEDRAAAITRTLIDRLGVHDSLRWPVVLSLRVRDLARLGLGVTALERTGIRTRDLKRSGLDVTSIRGA